MTGILVSVITPCLNARDWLERCLDNVAAQTYPNIEHIVVDGGSTDGTVELLQSRGVRFVSEPDSGQANAINKGFRLASGDLLGWLNADDLFVPDAIEAITDAFQSSPSAGWNYGQSRVEREGKLQPNLLPPRHIRKSTLESGNLLTQPGFFMRRWALERVGELDESFHLGMDYDLWLRLVDAGVPAVYVPRILAIYVVHEKSKTGNVDPSDFVREWAEALFKSGRTREAAFAFGRAASASMGSALSASEISNLAEQVVEDHRTRGRELDPGAVVAGATVETAMIELHRSPAGLRHLLKPQIWRYPQTRARVTLASRFLFRTLVLRARSPHFD